MPDITLSYETLTTEHLDAINKDLENKDALDILKWAYSQFGESLVYACSFGAEGMVLIDLISRVCPDARIVFLDTHVHFKETYELIERVKVRYPKLRIELKEPDLSLEQQAEQYGIELWKSSPDLCCKLRKLDPLEDVLKGAVAWLSGLRREQSPTRANTQFVNEDRRFQSIKVCPLIHWTWDDIWTYIKLYQLPYNELHDKGYPSIGCEHCTAPVKEGGDSRAGRWSGTGKTECGLHQ
ncbi:phosphoadenosine phosphosulfate reductase [Aneurinibacillus migulanus]|uniref:phosphoadenylyl-sulfate reductase n=1 Tax=Aneurinibacillus migulanus TaxID=47500 RepID=UPI0005B855CC|nr:phosphoadenylyl-sulfate reductase [Aneurinibacillus migulanus]KIV56966.1 phosphoadenosine phosphosulfate reductase [Aneurinibacillus migulanus]KPD05253.1 phosphoadenosine phosphosulfate reductase [Aneurinibacillus migulanus]MCP1357169.1 phosphoadenylyl-sulfate reductase [Aneurinibacillus migulanus]CEH28879.1 Phosphoadenosine phosphosulfate reductase (EC 1.8 .4.8) (3'-phosphoadenylylsulfate reductase) (PAPS reductase, thioredoxin dependent) (PAPS sulfotransferase) (PAdoPS re ductase) [Aneurin